MTIIGCLALIQDQDENYPCGRKVVGNSSRCDRHIDYRIERLNERIKSIDEEVAKLFEERKDKSRELSSLNLAKAEQHVWEEFPGGPPSDQHYKWCRRCGVMAVECNGESTEYYVAGTVNGSHRTETPPCREDT